MTYYPPQKRLILQVRRVESKRHDKMTDLMLLLIMSFVIGAANAAPVRLNSTTLKNPARRSEDSHTTLPDSSLSPYVIAGIALGSFFLIVGIAGVSACLRARHIKAFNRAREGQPGFESEEDRGRSVNVRREELRLGPVPARGMPRTPVLSGQTLGAIVEASIEALALPGPAVLRNTENPAVREGAAQ